MDSLGVVGLAAGAALLAATAWSDWRCRRIANGTLAGLVAVWGFVALFAPQALGGKALAGLLCGVAGLAVGYGLFRFGWIGGGDGKLLGAVALWLGPEDLGFGLLAASGLLLVLLSICRSGVGRERGIPFACALAPPTALLLADRCVELVS